MLAARILAGLQGCLLHTIPGAWLKGPSHPRAPQVKALGYDGGSPPSVPSWLDSLGLQDYVHSFLSSGYSSIDTVKNLWELELVNVSPSSLGIAGALESRALSPLLSLPGPEGSPTWPPQAHHRLPRREAL